MVSYPVISYGKVEQMFFPVGISLPKHGKPITLSDAVALKFQFEQKNKFQTQHVEVEMDEEYDWDDMEEEKIIQEELCVRVPIYGIDFFE